MRSLLLLTFLIGVCARTGAWAQDDAPCGPTTDAKAAKLIERGLDKRKYAPEERMAYLEEALERDESAVEAQCALGLLLFSEARRGRGGTAQARSLLEEVSERCPGFNEEVPYTLGLIAYAEERYTDAMDWFDRFTRWEHYTGRPLSPRSTRRVDEVASSLPEIRFLIDFNAHADSPDPLVLSEVASRDQEYLPALSPDGTLLFFTRAGERKAKGDLVSKPFEQFSWARRPGPSNPFDGGEPLGEPFNLSTGYGGASISVDNRLLYLAVKSPAPGNPENIDLYSARYTLFDDSGEELIYLWSDPEPLDALNTPDGWESQPSVSPDGQWLYFAAVRPGTTEDEQGQPSIDILVSPRGEDGNWGTPVNLPSPVNTAFSDKAPFLHPDGRTLYFASNRLPGGGGYDIWMSRLDSARAPGDPGAWSEPVNLGSPLNSEGDEHGLVTSADGKTAYFASRRPGTQGLDILTWDMPESLRAKASVVVRGNLQVSEDLADQPIGLELRYAQSKRAQTIDLGDDGRFAAVVDLDRGEDVLLVAKAEGAAFSAGLLVDRDAEAPALVEAELSVRSVSESDAAFEIEDIHYASGSAVIDRASLLLLDLFSEYLADTGLSVEIGGHTDDVGSEADNLTLSESRANAVRDYLILQGVPAQGITARGYGESRPRADNATAEGRSRNRRTEFRVNN